MNQSVRLREKLSPSSNALILLRAGSETLSDTPFSKGNPDQYLKEPAREFKAEMASLSEVSTVNQFLMHEKSLETLQFTAFSGSFLCSEYVVLNQ